MSVIHTDRFLPFVLGWLFIMLCLAAAVARVGTPSLKFLLTRAQGILGGASLLWGAWWLSDTTNSFAFAAVGCLAIVGVNFFTIRICPHCAKTIYPRQQLMLGFCPRCGADLSGPHERTDKSRG